MRIVKFITLTVLISLLSSCNHHDESEYDQVNNDYLLYATIYQQKSAEVAALYYQAYNIAELRLNQILENNPYEKPLAIVVDVDETVLDNSPFEAKSILENSDYPKYWKEWCEEASAKAFPGAVEFLNYALSNGVETFYITNRKIEFKDVTMKNLMTKGFPNVDDNHMLLRTSESNKENRRQKVLDTHEIVLLMGDNLNDFSSLFEAKLSPERHQIVRDLKSEFGNKFIILPNPTYGAWEAALLNNERLPKKEKLEKLKEQLETF